MTKVRWRPSDQTELDALIRRKQLFEEQSMQPLRDVSVDLLNELRFVEGVTFDELAVALRKHADSVRDALHPFDSGVRCAEKAPT